MKIKLRTRFSIHNKVSKAGRWIRCHKETEQGPEDRAGKKEKAVGVAVVTAKIPTHRVKAAPVPAGEKAAAVARARVKAKVRVRAKAKARARARVRAKATGKAGAGRNNR